MPRLQMENPLFRGQGRQTKGSLGECGNCHAGASIWRKSDAVTTPQMMHNGIVFRQLSVKKFEQSKL